MFLETLDMKKIFLSSFIFLISFFIFGLTRVSAKVLSSQTGTVDIPKTEVINDDLFIGAQSTSIEGTINGDVFIGAQTVRISGIINGNLHVGAQMITISGSVKGNVYAGAQDISLTAANIGGSILLGSQNLNIDKNTTVAGSVFSAAGVARIDSLVGRNVYVASGSLNIGADAKITKGLYYANSQNQQVNIDKNAKILGGIYRTEIQRPKVETKNIQKEAPTMFAFARMVAGAIAFISTLIVGLIYMQICKKHHNGTVEYIKNSFWKSLGAGFLITIGYIPAAIIVLMTVVGIPVVGLSFLILLIFIYISQIVVGSVVGNWVTAKLNWKMHSYWAFALGLLIIYLLECVPFVGFFTGLVVLWTGLGSLTIRLFSKTE